MTANPWPWQKDCAAFYGEPGNAARTAFSAAWYHENIVSVKCPWILTDGKNHFGFIPFHKKCAAPLARVLLNVWDALDRDPHKIHAAGYDVFSGTLNYRPMRTAHVLSMHAYGCAIDWDAPENSIHSQRHKFKADDLLFVKFREEQATCGIDWRGNSIDAMHVQFARVD